MATYSAAVTAPVANKVAMALQSGTVILTTGQLWPRGNS